MLGTNVVIVAQMSDDVNAGHDRKVSECTVHHIFRVVMAAKRGQQYYGAIIMLSRWSVYLYILSM